MEGQPDSVLVARAKRGQAAAVEALVRRYMRPAYAVALAAVRNAADAEDVAQEALMVALQRLDQCRDPARFAPWLLQSVRHRALNRLAQTRCRTALLEGAAPDGAVEGDAQRVLVRQRLLAALARLSDVQREVVLLHDMEAWTHAEIGAALDISEVLSRQHLFQARRALRAHLAQGEQGENGDG